MIRAADDDGMTAFNIDMPFLHVMACKDKRMRLFGDALDLDASALDECSLTLMTCVLHDR